MQGVSRARREDFGQGLRRSSRPIRDGRRQIVSIDPEAPEQSHPQRRHALALRTTDPHSVHTCSLRRYADAAKLALGCAATHRGCGEPATQAPFPTTHVDQTDISVDISAAYGPLGAEAPASVAPTVSRCPQPSAFFSVSAAPDMLRRDPCRSPLLAGLNVPAREGSYDFLA
jgi:hypothetical protein